MNRIAALLATCALSFSAHAQDAPDAVARGLAASALNKANSAIPSASINAPGGVQGYRYPSVALRPPTSSDDGTSGVPCVVNQLWTLPQKGLAWRATSCGTPGAHQAHWTPVSDPGLILDAVPGGHGWATFQASANYSSMLFSLTDLNSDTTNITALNGIGNYAVADAFVAAHPAPMASIPDANSAYTPAEVYVSQWFDQTQTGTAYNSTLTTGVLTATHSGGTGYVNGNTITLTTTGCTTVIVAPVITVAGVVSGAPGDVGIALGGPSTLTNPGVCAAGSFNAAQSQASTSGSGTGATWTITTYTQTPIWTASNQVGPVYRGLGFNSILNQMANAIDYEKFVYVPTLPWTPSSSTALMVIRSNTGEMTRGLYESAGAITTFLSDFYSASVNDSIQFSGGHGGCQAVLESTPTVFALTWNSAGSPTSNCQSGNTMGTGSNSATGVSAATGLDIGGLTQGFGSQFTLAGFFLWTTPLTQAQLNTAMLSLTLHGQFQPQTDTIVIVQGDSAYTSGSITTTTAFTKVPQLLGRSVKLYNQSFHGQNLCGSGGSQLHFPYALAPIYDATVHQIVYMNNEAANDIRLGTSIPTIEACMQSVVTQAHALGSNVSVALPMVIPQCSIVEFNSNAVLQEQYYEYLLQSSTASQASGGLGLTAKDTLINMASDPLFIPSYAYSGGVMFYNSSVYCSQPASKVLSAPNALSPEGDHQYEPFTDLWAALLGAGINSVLY